MFLDFFLIPSLIVLVYMMIFFVIGLIKKNNGLVDIGWGLGFVILAWYTLLSGSVTSEVQSLVTLLVTIWGLRLFYHLFRRNVGKDEDFRYAQWRRDWGKWVHVRAFFQIYILQGIMMLLVSSSFIIANTSREHHSLYLIEVIALIIWIIGFIFEVVGDRQLKRFIKDPKNKGKLCDVGLWRYTRHPNYFGEAVMWWGIWLMTLSYPYAWWGIISPIVITMLVRFVSGVPMLEKKWNDHPDFSAYKRQTNVFFPWFPRVDKSK